MGHTNDLSETNECSLSFIIINYNTAEITGNCIRSLIHNESLKNINAEIIVVDNASADGSQQILMAEFGTSIKFIRLDENIGFGRANNLAVKSARGKYLALVNSDTLANVTDFNSILRIADSDISLGFLSIRILNDDLSIQTLGNKFPDLFVDFKTHILFYDLNFFKKIRYRNYTPRGLFRVDWVSGCFMLVKRSVYNELQGFDGNIFMYAEDIDICFRAYKAGYSNYVYDNTSIIHLHGKSGTRKPSLAKMLNTVPNYFYIIKKNKLSRYLFLIKCFTYVNVIALWIVKSISYRKTAQGKY